MMTNQSRTYRRLPDGGFSLIEVLLVFTVMGIITVIAIPQLAAFRRLQRTAAIPVLIKSQLRLARQQARSQRRAVTFQYDNQLKQISLITQPNPGAAILNDPNYPNVAGSVRTTTTNLTGNGITAPELVYGLPPSAVGNLTDTTTLSPLTGTRYINITFQPDGSVINGAGVPTNFALFFYNSNAPKDTAAAISVLGSAGRVKVWRYNVNGNTYTE